MFTVSPIKGRVFGVFKVRLDSGVSAQFYLMIGWFCNLFFCLKICSWDSVAFIMSGYFKCMVHHGGKFIRDGDCLEYNSSELGLH